MKVRYKVEQSRIFDRLSLCNALLTLLDFIHLGTCAAHRLPTGFRETSSDEITRRQQPLS